MILQQLRTHLAHNTAKAVDATSGYCGNSQNHVAGQRGQAALANVASFFEHKHISSVLLGSTLSATISLPPIRSYMNANFNLYVTKLLKHATQQSFNISGPIQRTLLAAGCRQLPLIAPERGARCGRCFRQRRNQGASNNSSNTERFDLSEEAATRQQNMAAGCSSIMETKKRDLPEYLSLPWAATLTR